MTGQKPEIQAAVNPLPMVSVVIPTYHDWSRLKLCLDALAAQTIPAERTEVIVVNNDPFDPCPYPLPAPNMRIVTESRPGSYAARNAGIGASRADILAFTDSDCIPDRQWLEQGVLCLQKEGVMLAGGQVRFMMDRPVSASALLEAAGHMDNEDTIARHGCAVTANLFVHRQVFQNLGLFDGSVKSGGDIAFTQRASAGGYLLVYCHKALVMHPTRSFSQKLRKAFRVGKGLPFVERKRPASSGKKTVMLLLHLVPITHPRRIRRAMKLYSVRQSGVFAKAMFLSVVLGVVKTAGILASLPYALFAPEKTTGKIP